MPKEVFRKYLVLVWACEALWFGLGGFLCLVAPLWVDVFGLEAACSGSRSAGPSPIVVEFHRGLEGYLRGGLCFAQR